MGDDLYKVKDKAERKRGSLLSVVLIIGLVLFGGGAIYLFLVATLGFSALLQAFPQVSQEYWLWGALIGVANFIAFVGLWWWRRWGFYMILITSLIGLLVDISLPYVGGPLSLIRSLILVGLLIILLRKHWDSMV
jgi:hypothetical protein